MSLPSSAPADAQEHQVESATTAGFHPGRNADAVSVFHLEVPGVSWNAVVLAIADGGGWPIRGDVASAVAVAGVEQGLTDRFRQLDVRTAAWQDQVAEAFMAAFAHAHHRIRALREPGPEPTVGVGLTLALLLGDCLCVAHAGDGRVYRRSRNELQQLTADQGGRSSAVTVTGSNRRLGLTTQQPPAVRFFQLKAGDQILVCSKGLSHQLDGTVLAHLMSASTPLSQLARHLITVAALRRAADDASLCLTRVRRLPARLPPSGRIDFEQAAEAATLPRYSSRTGLPWDARQVVTALGTMVLVVGLLLGWRVWRPLSPAVVALHVPEEQLPGNGVGALGSAQVDVSAEAPTPAPAPARDSAIEPLVVAPPSEDPPRPQPVRAPDPQRVRDSLLAIQRAAATTTQRAAAERARRDSAILQERLTEERLQRLRDQARATPPAQKLPDPQVQAEQDRRAAEQRRADQEAASVAAAAKAATAERAAAVKVTAGTSALDSWLNALVSAVNTGTESAALLAPGPTSFVAFVDKYHPRLSDARLVQRTVDSETARATVEWVARWKNTFGTASSQRMTAVVTMVPLGDSWQVTGWRITEGAR